MPTKHKLSTCVLSREYPVFVGFLFYYFCSNVAMLSHALDDSIHLSRTWWARARRLKPPTFNPTHEWTGKTWAFILLAKRCFPLLLRSVRPGQHKRIPGERRTSCRQTPRPSPGARVQTRTGWFRGGLFQNVTSRKKNMFWRWQTAAVMQRKSSPIRDPENVMKREC